MFRPGSRLLRLLLALVLCLQSGLGAAHCLRLAAAPAHKAFHVEICTSEGIVLMDLGGTSDQDAPSGHDHAGFCLACRRRTGSAVHWGAYFPPEAVRLEGESVAYSSPADSGATLTFRFCPTCGTSLLWGNDRTPDRVGIPAGCFADPAFPAPTAAVWEIQAVPWLKATSVTDHWNWGTGMTAAPDTEPCP